MYENSYLKINLDILKNNAKNIVNKYSEYKYKIAMVKGDAYGHGSFVVKTLIDSGFNYLAASSLKECLQIRKYTNAPILCTEPIDLKYIDDITNNNITITIHNIEYLKKLIELNSNVKVHFKIDSGMNRLGFKSKEEFNNAVSLINDNIIFEGIYSHFSTTGIIDKTWDNQVKKFKNIISDINLEDKIVHFASSFSLLSHPKIDVCNGFRIGSVIFGINTSISYGNSFKDILRKIRNRYFQKKNNLSLVYTNIDLNVKTCLSLYSKVIEVKNVNKGEYIGYSESYKAETNIKVAIVDIGYKDGIGRKNNNRKVLINGKLYDVIGDIEMCMILVKVDDNVKVGDEAELFGENISISKMCEYKNETIHEVFLSLGKVLQKKYIENNKLVKITYIDEKEV